MSFFVPSLSARCTFAHWDVSQVKNKRQTIDGKISWKTHKTYPNSLVGSSHVVLLSRPEMPLKIMLCSPPSTGADIRTQFPKRALASGLSITGQLITSINAQHAAVWGWTDNPSKDWGFIKG